MKKVFLVLSLFALSEGRAYRRVKAVSAVATDDFVEDLLAVDTKANTSNLVAAPTNPKGRCPKDGVRHDCPHGDPVSCRTAGCCWTPGAGPWCFRPLPERHVVPITGSNPWNAGQSMLIYEMDVLHFGNGIRDKQHVGSSFQLATTQLERLRDHYGVNTIWVMPPYKRYKASPYATNDFYKIDNRLGTEKDAKAFVDKAHSLSMKVLFDVTTIGHGCNSAKGMNGVKQADRHLMVSGGKKVLNYGDLCQYQYCTNLDKVREFYTDIVNHWVEKLDIDGYRCDSADLAYFYKKQCAFKSVDFWKPLISSVRKAHKKDLFFLAENSSPSATWLKLAGFNSQYGEITGAAYPGAHKELVLAIRNGDRKNYQHLSQKLDLFWRLQTGSFAFMNYIVNHDIWAYGVGDLPGKPGSPLGIFKSAEGANRAWLLATFGSTGTLMMCSGQEFGYTKNHEYFNNAEKWIKIDRKKSTPAIQEMSKFLGKLFVQNGAFFRDGDLAFCNKAPSFAIVRKAPSGQRIGAFIGSGCQSQFADLAKSLLTDAVRKYAEKAGIDVRTSGEVTVR